MSCVCVVVAYFICTWDLRSCWVHLRFLTVTAGINNKAQLDFDRYFRIFNWDLQVLDKAGDSKGSLLEYLVISEEGRGAIH